ncbi:MAG: RnfABCDGE type electron transport complex subunit B [Candidatus Heteroscillospira sp.]|jgi:electron transport complex protein RnfB
MSIVYPVVVLSVMGAAFGLLLAIASKIFAVEVDERQELIAEVLPGANCGGCGFAGCSAYAAAVVAGEAPTNKCAAGGNAAAAKIAAIMGQEAAATEKMVAHVKCSAHTGHSQKKFEYSGLTDCLAAMRLGGGQGPNECPNGCIGFGTCVKACPFDAIHIVDGIAEVDHEKCVGCQSCVAICPKHVIDMVPYEAPVTVGCASTQKGAVTRKVCDIGCIGCKICEKTCESDAIHVTDNLAYIDYAKCTHCGKCAEKCPRHIIMSTVVTAANGEEKTVPVVGKDE